MKASAIGGDKGSCGPEHGKERDDTQNMRDDTACNGQPTIDIKNDRQLVNVNDRPRC